MSVILFCKSEVFQKMANAYASLSHYMLNAHPEEYNQEFYDSLCYLHYANIAAYMATYAKGEGQIGDLVKGAEFFTEIQGKRSFEVHPIEELAELMGAWSHLQYNLVTNGGEMFIPRKAFDFVQATIEKLACRVTEVLAEHSKSAREQRVAELLAAREERKQKEGSK